jgi:hypothetical protein
VESGVKHHKTNQPTKSYVFEIKHNYFLWLINCGVYFKSIFLLGTSKGGNDVVEFQNIGVVQHKAFHQLHLQNGYQYYATLKGELILSQKITPHYMATENNTTLQGHRK